MRRNPHRQATSRHIAATTAKPPNNSPKVNDALEAPRFTLSPLANFAHFAVLLNRLSEHGDEPDHEQAEQPTEEERDVFDPRQEVGSRVSRNTKAVQAPQADG